MDQSEQQQQIEKLAKDILALSRNTLLVNLRFLDLALSQLKLEPYSGTIAVDGEHVFYNPRFILEMYKNNKELTTRVYLHMAFHCVFRHNFVDIFAINQPIWNLSCDIAVENMINSLNQTCVHDRRMLKQIQVIEELKKELNVISAEKIYRYYLEKKLTQAHLEKMQELFYGDDHEPWYQFDLVIDVEGVGNGSESTDSGKGDNGFQKVNEQLVEFWKKTSERMMVDIEMFSKSQGLLPGDLVQNLQAINREKYDYTKFLRQFCVPAEALKTSEDEFDYIFYTYGLKMYDKMPLIEPLEYQDVKRIREFVIAIDTSGSVAGETVQAFLQKTYNILKQEETFHRKFNLFIIQCDADIQEAVHITNQEEFDCYLQNMTLKGFGGTDFRPVFDYVEKLQSEKVFTNLKGLIYFTDGWGAFPVKMPEYRTAFVFLDDEVNNYEVPPWAIKLILQRHEI